jgi:hypothetical protein
MKHKFLLLLLLAIFGCEKSNEPVGIDGKTFFGDGVYPPKELVAKEKLPEWLNIKISEYEDTHSAILPLIVFQGKWEERIIFYMYYYINSCQFCDVYYENGENIVWTTDAYFDNFQSTSKEWILIYAYAFLQ